MNEKKRTEGEPLVPVATTLRKSMRSVEQLLAEVASGGEKLSPSEERLIDRITFEHTGKHFGRFAKPQAEEKYDFPTISKDTSFHATTKADEKKPSKTNRKKTEAPTRDRTVPVVSGVAVDKPTFSVESLTDASQKVS